MRCSFKGHMQGDWKLLQAPTVVEVHAVGETLGDHSSFHCRR